MISEKLEWKTIVRILLLLVMALLLAFVILERNYVYLLFLLPVMIWQITDIYRSMTRSRHELEKFAESVRYRDFTSHFGIKNTSAEQAALRTAFNEINAVFRSISREKETQHQYLQNILELVNTGILSFETETAEVIWMNESLKKMLNLPYIKTLHSFERRDELLYREMVSLKAGESRIATAHADKKSFKVLLSATAFQTDGKKYTLIAFQNINEAIDETETKAWQKLLSVLTHEIMNSIAPISSLADTVTNRLQVITKEGNHEVLEDLGLAVDTIKRRSEGLLKFAEIYRSLNKITVPNLETIYARDIFENLHHLMQPKLAEMGIGFDIILKDPDLFFEADLHLMEQVIINLLVNAIEAVKDSSTPQIILSAYKEESGKTVISVADNGMGIPEELADRIFVPFFTTKKNGSGIGLTLCKQIMLLHHGNIEAQSATGAGTNFLLTL